MRNLPPFLRLIWQTHPAYLSGIAALRFLRAFLPLPEPIRWLWAAIAICVALSAAVAEMNRYSTTTIVVADAALDRHRVNGMFRTGHQASFVEALAAYFPLTVEREADGRIALRESLRD